MLLQGRMIQASEQDMSDSPQQQPPDSQPADAAEPETRPPKLPPTPVTNGLLILVIVLYAISSYPHFRFAAGPLMEWGRFEPGAVADGEYWRFVTANLLHADWSHLFHNVLGILIFGKLVEPVIGGRGFLGLCILTGLASMGFSWLLLDAPTVGASGIGYGLIGAYIMLVLLISRFVDRHRFDRELQGAIAFILIYSFLNWTEAAGVNIWGHLGGALAGMAYAFALFQRRLRKKPD